MPQYLTGISTDLYSECFLGSPINDVGDHLHLTATGKKKVGDGTAHFDSIFNQENDPKKIYKISGSYSRWTESKYEFKK